MPPLTDAQRVMVKANTGLVGFVLRSRIAESDYDDAFQDGLMGLMRATQLFDPERGIRFSTYAVQWIRAGVQHGLLNLEGVNFRRAHANGTLHITPLSLDAEFDDGGQISTPVDTGPRPDEVGVDRARIDEARRAGDAACRDEIDRAVLDALFDEEHRSMSRLDIAVAKSAGMSRQGVQVRRRRLQAIIVAAVDRCAA